MNRALRHVLARLGWAAVVVIGVGTVAFFLSRSLPGDPVRLLVGPSASPASVERARVVYGLGQPPLAQYLRFWQRLLHRHPESKSDPPEEHLSCARLGAGLHLDLGYSYRYQQPVTTLIAKKAPLSLRLALAAVVLQLFVGVGVGLLSACTRGSFWDQTAIGAVLLGVSAPCFVTGLALQYVLAHRLGWLPCDGYGTTAAEQLRALVLPALTLGIYGAALYARISRDEIGSALGADYVRTARAKGASALRATLVHALRNALVPIATLVVLDLGALIGGAIVTEKLFRWPGMGSMAVDALINRDGPVVFGTVLFSAAAIVAATLALDVLYLWLDPRLRRS
jgi:peptide/nickel transport system permease protein